MAYPRSARVADLIRNELADLLLREVKDPRVENIVITRVEVSPDLHNARVYFSRYGKDHGDEKEVQEGLEGLERATGFLQGRIGERIRLKKTPRLSFEIDRHIAYSDEIDRLLHSIQEKETGEGRG
ncbi:MAG: 30S ribosome-binding factor RbfA [bacterium]|nr:30S ribosome-binding factor RbfA [bacterium]